ncbi:probable maltase-glucoamylase 2 [Euwallacea fornicatus]|uniref:probable maltase-glucoamylase 2 n=1 Tax=Euwallacea fornicatus TaxID=995702 RepID=UPI00338FEFD4
MRVLVFVGLLCAVQIDCQTNFWNYPHNFFTKLLRQGKNSVERVVGTTTPGTTTLAPTTIKNTTPYTTQFFLSNKTQPTRPATTSTTTQYTTTQIQTEFSTVKNVTTPFTSTTTPAISTTIDFSTASTIVDTTTPDFVATTGEPRENTNGHEFYIKKEKPLIKISSNISQNLLPLPAGAGAALVKPTKYHYYPHNQHMYLLPECAIQQVCNAVYVRLNWTQPLCACPSRYRDPCSASLNSDDLHTTELSINKKSRKAVTLVKTCEPTSEMRICRAPRDWSLLALQNIRTGKSHYLVICRCPDSSTLEGPMSHDQPTYASVPGIRVYGMMCVDNKRRGRPLRTTRSLEMPPFPWQKARELAESALWD